MKKIKPLLIIFFLVSSAFASDYRVELKMNYFNPSKQIFKDVYGSGFMIGIKAAKIHIYKKFGLVVETGYLNKKGELTFTREKTSMRIFFLGPGIIYQHSEGIFDMYAGAGIRYYRFQERNPIGKAQQGKLGYFIGLGTYIDIGKNFFADFGINYSLCEVKPADVKVEIGGLEVGIGVAYEF